MTQVKCRQRQCANWDAGVCGSLDVTVDERGVCLTQDEEMQEILDTLSPACHRWAGPKHFEPTVDPDMEDDDWDDDDLSSSDDDLDDDDLDWDDDAGVGDDQLRRR